MCFALPGIFLIEVWISVRSPGADRDGGTPGAGHNLKMCGILAQLGVQAWKPTAGRGLKKQAPQGLFLRKHPGAGNQMTLT
jgi:hypothetical protein